MENKQTAVEWLIETINEGGGFIFTSHYEKLFNKAKQIEKEQIEEAYMVSDDSGTIEESIKWSEQYYNDTYGKE